MLGLLVLTACQFTAERICSEEGYEQGTPEFTQCVADRRTQEAVRMQEEAARGTGRGRVGQ